MKCQTLFCGEQKCKQYAVCRNCPHCAQGCTCCCSLKEPWYAERCLYLPKLFRQMCLSKLCRPRSHCSLIGAALFAIQPAFCFRWNSVSSKYNWSDLSLITPWWNSAESDRFLLEIAMSLQVVVYQHFTCLKGSEVVTVLWTVMFWKGVKLSLYW